MPAVALRDAQRPFILGVDVGTSSIKVLAFDSLGRRIEGLEDRREYSRRITPDGGATFDAGRLFDRVVKAIDGVTGQAPEKSGTFAAVAFSTLWHSLVGLDGAGKPLTPLSTWADIESAPAVPTLKRRHDEREIHFRTGCMFHPSFWPAKLLWVAKSNRVLFRAVAHWASLGDYLALRFGGELTSSYSIASGTGIFDGRRCVWDEEMLDSLGVSEDRLPAVADLPEGGRTALPRWRERWPALSEAVWLPAIGDGACGSVGGGSHRADRAALMIGTSGALRWVLPDTELRIPPGLFRYRLDRNRIVVGGALSAGGNTHAWIRERLKFERATKIGEQIAGLPPNGHGLTVLPFFSGDRSPTWNASARAVIAGLTMETTPAEIARATAEAVAYRFALIEELAAGVVGSHEIVGSGGALESSPVWTQIIADVLQRPIQMSGEVETSSRGAALLALEALGLIESLDDVETVFDETVLPRREHREAYEQGFAEHQRLSGKILGHRRA